MKEEMRAALKAGMKAHEKVKVETLRGILTAIQYEEVAQKTENLPATTITEILKREIKKRKEELDFAKQANRADAITKLDEEIAVVESFLPKQMSSADLEKIITDLKAENPAANMGIVMKTLKEKYSGQYDSKLASDLAKRIAG